MLAANRMRLATLPIVLFAAAGAHLAFGQSRDEKVIHEAPGIRVFEKTTALSANEPEQTIRTLLQYDTQLGNQLIKPKGDPNVTGILAKDYSRLATTYYHRHGPLGQTMERFNWFHGPDAFHFADFRLPASVIGGGPSGMLCTLWSEPAIAVVGIDVGTPAAYARPYQTMHFYEANPKLAELTFSRPGREPIFTFARDAYFRGAVVRHFPGAPRESLAKSPCDRFYQLMAIELYKDSIYTIHRDLLTQEAMAMCMSKLTPQGMLCYHVSNRYCDLVPVLSAAADNLGLSSRLALDNPRDMRAVTTTHFSSAWLFVSREMKRLDDLEAQSRGLSINCTAPPADKRFLWRDGQPNSLNGLMRYDPQLGWIKSRVSHHLGLLLYLGLSRRDILGIDQSWQQACHRINEFLMLVRDY